METKLGVKNWGQFQHYLNRRPPWLKLHRQLLDDFEYHALEPLAAKYLPLIWIVASDFDGKLPDWKTLAFRLRLPEEQCAAICKELSHWLITADSTMLATDGCNASDRKRQSREDKRNKRKKGEEADKDVPPPPPRPLNRDFPGSLPSAAPSGDPEPAHPRSAASKGIKARGPCFRDWDAEMLRAAVRDANRDGILTEEEIDDFVDYWMEPGPDRKPRLATQKAWETRRRMKTALRAVYEPRRRSAGHATAEQEQDQRQKVYMTIAQEAFDIKHSSDMTEAVKTNAFRDLRLKYRDWSKRGGKDVVQRAIEFGENAIQRPGSEKRDA